MASGSRAVSCRQHGRGGEARAGRLAESSSLALQGSPASAALLPGRWPSCRLAMRATDLGRAASVTEGVVTYLPEFLLSADATRFRIHISAHGNDSYSVAGNCRIRLWRVLLSRFAVSSATQ